MRWVLASVGLLVVIVVFSMAALDQRDVVWESGVAKCPHCRTDVNAFSSVCADCGRAFDWKPHDVDCTWCPAPLDASYYRRILDENEDAWNEKIAALELTEDRRDDLESYVKGLRSGNCMFCGGTGKWLDIGVDGEAANGGRTPLTVKLQEALGGVGGDCPVCFGRGRCVGCDGDHRTSVARETATRGLVTLTARRKGINLSRDEESFRAAFDAVADFVRKNAGTREILELPSLDLPDCNLDARGKTRAMRVLSLIEELPADR